MANDLIETRNSVRALPVSVIWSTSSYSWRWRYFSTPFSVLLFLCRSICRGDLCWTRLAKCYWSELGGDW